MSFPELPALERHYKPAQLAKAWGYRTETVIQLFKNEPGVIRKRGPQGKRISIRIPESIVERVYKQLQSA